MIPNKQCPSSNRNKISFEIDYKQQHKKDVPMHSQFTCTTQLCCTTPLNTMYKYKFISKYHYQIIPLYLIIIDAIER
jgi:hypothetical protein